MSERDGKARKPEAAPETATDEMSTLAELAGEMVEAGQAAALGVLEAEVDALKDLAKAKADKDAAAHEARLREEDEEAEDGFDNMPV